MNIKSIPYLLIAAAVTLLTVAPPSAAAQSRDGGGKDRAAPGEEMVLIPAGEFVMGSDDGGDDCTPHTVRIDSFYIDRYEVTNAQYLVFCTDTGRPLPEFWGIDALHSGPDFPDHPVVGINRREAAAYAEWCGKRLPTEAEWEYAARGGLAGKAYPHGNEITPEDANHAKSDHQGTVPVGSYAPNGFGLYDMTGNAAEWTADWYGADYYTTGPNVNPTGPPDGKFAVFRGGGWHTGPYCCRLYYRNALPANFRDFNVGFRCAKDCAGTRRKPSE